MEQQPQQQKVLVIDDSEAIHGLLQVRLRTEPIDLYFSSDGEAGLARAAEIQPDLILLDVDMPAPDGFEVCRRLKSDMRTSSIPVVFLSGITSPEDKIKGLDLGAVDYITKPFDPAELRARVRASLRTKYLMDLLSHKAMIDGLTGLWNRRYFESRLAAELSLNRRNGQPVSCIMIDLDHFKSMNDKFGHPFGDTVLRSVGQLLGAIGRNEDVVCRYGGEEFVILAPGANAKAAGEFAERIRVAIGALRWDVKSMEVSITCSLGVSELSGDAPPSIVDMADEALYAAKNSGRNCVVISPAITVNTAAWTGIEGPNDTSEMKCQTEC